MNLSVTGHHLAVTPSIRNYVDAKLERVLRHFDHIIDVHVIVSVQKLQHHAEVTLHVRGKDIFVEADSHNLYAALDALGDKLDRVVMKYKARAYSRTHDAIKHQEIDSPL